MKKIKEIIMNNADMISIGIGTLITLGFVVLTITLIKLDKEIG